MLMISSMDHRTFASYGMAWCRSCKATKGFNRAFVIDNGLDSQDSLKLVGNNVKVIKREESHVWPRQLEVMRTIDAEFVRHYAPDDILFQDATCELPDNSEFIFALAGDRFVVLPEQDVEPDAVVEGFRKLDQRARYAIILGDHVAKKHGSLVGTRVMYGKPAAWAVFLGFLNSLTSLGIIEGDERSVQLAANLFVYYFPTNVMVHNSPAKRRAA